MRLAFIGVGPVGASLSRSLIARGHDVAIAARDPGSDLVKRTVEHVPGLRVLPMVEGVRAAEVVFLSAPFAAVASMLAAAGEALTGRILVDCTNPIGPDLRRVLTDAQSGAEVVQSLAQGAHVVKAFSIYSPESLENAVYPGYGLLRPTMPVAGDDAAAKQVVSALCRELGWEPVDVGPLANSLHLEHLAILSLKMTQAAGDRADLAWALLERSRSV